tara:strand:+ start:131 stop:334 length:204 start_codon:yes stop_codon:yes gene_type:complete
MSVAKINEQRQKAAAAYAEMDNAVNAEKRKMHIAHFEISTTKKIEERMKNVCISVCCMFIIIYCRIA